VNMPDEARRALEALQSQEPLEPGPLLEALTILSPLVLFGLLFQCVVAAGVYRIQLQADQGSVRTFHLGATELRLVALTLIYVVLLTFAIAAATLISVIAAAIASVAGQGAAVLVGSLTWLLSLGFIVFAAVRLSLAPVITFEQDKLALLDSWPVTRGQFWRLTGAYLLAICCVVVVALLALMVFLPVAGLALLVTGGSLSELGAMMQPSEPTLSAYFAPLRVLYMLYSSVVAALYYAVIAAPGAFAYRALRPQA
jgi:hypothetical protein